MSREENCVTLSCDDCGDPFDTSARSARHIARGDWPSRCSRCRSAARRRNPRPAPSAGDRQFWIDQFGLSGAVELSLAIWGPTVPVAEPYTEIPERLVASVGE